MRATNVNTQTTVNVLGCELLATRNQQISLTIKNHSNEWIRTKASARAWYFQNRANASL